MRLTIWSLLLFLAASPVCPQSSSSVQPKEIVSFDLDAIDRGVNACTDFYEFACGNWRKNNPIPPDKARWGRFDELADRNLSLLREILEKAADAGAPGPERQIGDFYAACMDEPRIESLGARPIQADLDAVAKIRNRRDLMRAVARLHTVGVPALLGWGSTADLHDATRMVAVVDQGGISLPDRDYYIKDDVRSKETREKFLEHVSRMFGLLGRSQEDSAAAAKTVLAVETALARASMDRTLRRDPKNRDHFMKLSELAKLAPNFDFPRFFEASRAPKFDSLNVANPEFFKQVSAQLESVPVADWKTYLSWQVLSSRADYLSSLFVNESFRFNNQYLVGQKEIAPRWKRCVRLADVSLGEALGRIYVEKHFGADGKERTLRMVKAIESAMEKDIAQIDWMSAATKEKARQKLAAIVNNIGYPDRWRDYSSIRIARDDLAGNVVRAAAFEERRQVAKIGGPVDRTEWSMTPQTVNAYYRGSRNDINFPAGILQPPFFSRTIDDPVNFGAIGLVIGHELTHGFDDQGRKFDASGNLTDWWTEQDATEFDKRAACVDEQYSQYVAVKDDKGEVRLNGKLTLGENVADNGGLRLAHSALMDTLTDEGGKKTIDGFTSEQRFFIGYAQVWCQNATDQISRLRALTDPHSPGRYRVIGVVANSPEFRDAFGCKPGDPMVRENACRVW
ncbi:MAG TPA: M13 family metallopeptidase [Bryobacteraceae bacterium]|nr:M13 family metallopeptidase [Bryobacteraceae bacterium]